MRSIAHHITGTKSRAAALAKDKLPFNRKLIPPGFSVVLAANGEGKKFIRVRIGKKRTLGKAEVRNFAFDKAEFAVSWMKQRDEDLLHYGASSLKLSDEQLSDAIRACKLINGRPLSLCQAVELALKYKFPATQAGSTEELINLYVEQKRLTHTSAVTCSAYSVSLKLFFKRFKNLSVNEITKQQIMEYIFRPDWKPSTQDHHLRNLKVFFNWARREKYISDNPTEGIEPPKLKLEIQILTPSQARQLLARAPESMVPALAISLFAGLRASEVRRLAWRDIVDDEIYVSALKSKTGDGRIIDIRPNLSQWFEIYRKADGYVAPQEGWREKLQKCAKLAGIDPWPRNCMRHSFATYAKRISRNATQTADEMGNSPEMLKKHYARSVNKADAEAYWAITPEIRKCGASNS